MTRSRHINHVWTEEENNILVREFPCSTRQEIERFLPHIPFKKIQSRAHRLGLKLIYRNRTNVRGDISSLLDETPISYYWMGFLLADGHFSESCNIHLHLGLQDLEHLRKFAEFIKTKNVRVRKSSAVVSIQDKKWCVPLRNKFDIVSNKTYKSPSNDFYNRIEDDLFVALVVGYIDGDGSIQTSSYGNVSMITISSHSSWNNFFDMISMRMSNLVGRKLPLSRIRYGKSLLNFAQDGARYLKLAAIRMNLPFLGRKWNKVNEAYFSRRGEGLRRFNAQRRQLNSA